MPQLSFIWHFAVLYNCIYLDLLIQAFLIYIRALQKWTLLKTIIYFSLIS